MTTIQPTARELVDSYVAERGITEVLHFTTDKGLLGVLAKGVVLSRDRLEVDQYIEHIRTLNCSDRLKDADWTDYVNLSISRVNKRMLNSSMHWHRDGDTWWAVLSLDVSLLGDDGVYFTTTNNTYHNCVKRGTGVASLRELFASRVKWGYYGSILSRSKGMPNSWTTDPQAEVLYPGQIGTSRLRAIYLPDDENIDLVNSWLAILPNAPQVPVIVKPEVFQ